MPSRMPWMFASRVAVEDGAVFGKGELLRGVFRGLPVGVLRSALHVVDGLAGELKRDAQLHQRLDLALAGDDAVCGSGDGLQVAGARLRAERCLPAKERPRPAVRPDSASAFSSSLPQSATMRRRRWAPAPDGGYSSFSPFSDPILSDVSCADEAGSDVRCRRGDALWIPVGAGASAADVVEKCCRRHEKQAAGDGGAEVEQPVVVARRTADEHILQHGLGDARGAAIADEVGAELAVAGPAKGHVVAQDLEFFSVFLDDGQARCARRPVSRRRSVRCRRVFCGR